MVAYNLRQIKGIIADGVEDEVLQLVDRRQQVVAEGSHDDRYSLAGISISLSSSVCVMCPG